MILIIKRSPERFEIYLLGITLLNAFISVNTFVSLILLFTYEKKMPSYRLFLFSLMKRKMSDAPRGTNWEPAGYLLR